MNGRGKITYKNGNVYEGEWKDGKKFEDKKIVSKGGLHKAKGKSKKGKSLYFR